MLLQVSLKMATVNLVLCSLPFYLKNNGIETQPNIQVLLQQPPKDSEYILTTTYT